MPFTNSYEFSSQSSYTKNKRETPSHIFLLPASAFCCMATITNGELTSGQNFLCLSARLRNAGNYYNMNKYLSCSMFHKQVTRAASDTEACILGEKSLIKVGHQLTCTKVTNLGILHGMDFKNMSLKTQRSLEDSIQLIQFT